MSDTPPKDMAEIARRILQRGKESLGDGSHILSGAHIGYDPRVRVPCAPANDTARLASSLGFCLKELRSAADFAEKLRMAESAKGLRDAQWFVEKLLVSLNAENTGSPQ